MLEMHGLWRHKWVLLDGTFMTPTLREQGIEMVHDQVVSLVARRWAKAFACKVTIKTDLERVLWGESNQFSDLVGWYVNSSGNTIEWMGEIETENSLAGTQAVDKWKRLSTEGIPLYVVVPRGMKERALRLAQEASITVACIYEFTFINGVCHIL
jgi:hypothetical protein